MTVYNWSTLSNNQSLTFNPATDKLNFDDISASAFSIGITTTATKTSFTLWTKSVTLQAELRSFTKSNVTFADGSFFLVGDNTTGTTNDDGPNALTGSIKNDTIFGLGGDDSIQSGAGDDYIDGGSGSDLIAGGDGADEIAGNEGNDSIDGGSGNDYIEGSSGNDLISGGDGSDEIYGMDGTDSIDGGSGDDALIAGNGLDTLFGGDGNDELYSRSADMISGSDDGANSMDG